MKPSDVVIAGCGAVSAAGVGVCALRGLIASNESALSSRTCSLGKTTNQIVGGFVPSGVEAELGSQESAFTGSRVALYAAKAANEAQAEADAILAPVPAERCAFVLSTTKANIDVLDELISRRELRAMALRHLHPSFLAADLAAHFECAGPVVCVSTACVSGLLALQQAASLIRRDQADRVLVVGVDLISNFVLTGFLSLNSLDGEGCRPFDRNRAGLSLGEGAGAMVLTRFTSSLGGCPRLTGFGSSNDANHLTGPSRDGSGLAAAMQRALKSAEIGTEDVEFLHAHGTGTAYNDNMEALAFRSVFGGHVPPFSSSKGAIGHTLGAAGILETVLCLAALKDHVLPGTARLREADSVAGESVLAAPRPVNGVRRIMKVNCGFGGTNAAVVVEGGPW